MTTEDGTWVQNINRFWFEELTPQQWFRGGSALDETIRTRYATLLPALASREITVDDRDALAAVASVIVLDQFPRNLFRGTASAFSYDAPALSRATRAVDLGIDQELSDRHKYPLYMPFMHSEQLVDQQRAIALFETIPDSGGLRWAIKHCKLIEQFGRFPHRNDVLGRPNTPEETDYLRTATRFGQ